MHVFMLFGELAGKLSMDSMILYSILPSIRFLPIHCMMETVMSCESVRDDALIELSDVVRLLGASGEAVFKICCQCEGFRAFNLRLFDYRQKFLYLTWTPIIKFRVSIKMISFGERVDFKKLYIAGLVH